MLASDKVVEKLVAKSSRRDRTDSSRYCKHKYNFVIIDSDNHLLVNKKLTAHRYAIVLYEYSIYFSGTKYIYTSDI